MLDLRKRIFIIISLVVGFVLATTLAFRFFSKKSGGAENASVVGVDQPVDDEASGVAMPKKTSGSSSSAPAAVPFVPSEKSREVYAKQMAKLFVERFTTFSNQNDNVHIDDVLALTTVSMGKWVETQEIKEGSIYEGITTNVISASLQSIDENGAVVKVETQQIKSEGGTETIAYRPGTVQLVADGDDWKVDGFYWDTN